MFSQAKDCNRSAIIEKIYEKERKNDLYVDWAENRIEDDEFCEKLDQKLVKQNKNKRAKVSKNNQTLDSKFFFNNPKEKPKTLGAKAS